MFTLNLDSILKFFNKTIDQLDKYSEQQSKKVVKCGDKISKLKTEMVTAGEAIVQAGTIRENLSRLVTVTPEVPLPEEKNPE